MDYLALAEHGIAIAGAVVSAASAICALTRTPDPTTPLGKVYRTVELLGLLVGRAKELGIMPGDPTADKAAAFAVDVAKDALGKA